MNTRTRLVAIMITIILGALVVSAPSAFAYYSGDLVTNGGFEADPIGNGWTLVPSTTQTIGAFSGTSWHSGSRGLKLGSGLMQPLGSDQLTQYIYDTLSISIPTNATTITFTAWYNILSDEVLVGYDKLAIVIYNNADSTQHFCNFVVDAAQATQNTWLNLTCDLSAAKGKNIAITAGLVTDKTGITNANVDDISIAADYPDVTAPTTSISFPKANANGFFSAPPKITLSASDDVGGSGVQSIVYGWDTAGTTPYTGAIIAPKGKHTLYYSSRDNSGNVESTKTKEFNVAPIPKITTITTNKPQNTFNIIVKNKKVVLRPFLYQGNVWARKIDYGKELGVFYLFGTQESSKQGGLVMYDANGKQVASVKPFWGSVSPGMEYQMVIQKSSDMIFLVVTSKKDASNVKTFSVTRKGFTNIGTLKTGQKANAGQMVSQFLKLYDGDYGLVTAIAGKMKTIKVWEYDSAAKRFSQDKAADLSVIKLSGPKITHK